MSIQQTDDIDTGIDNDDAVAALVAQMTPAPKKPSSDANPAPHEQGDEDEEYAEDEDEDEGEYEEELSEEDGEDPSEDDEGDEDEEDGEEDADEDEEQSDGSTPVADDAVVSVVVNGEEQQFTVGSLKRLAGQEASLTRKSQEADQVGQRAAAVLSGALEVIAEDLKAYQNTDWVLEGQRMDPEEFAWHRENFTKLQGRYQKIVGEAQSLDQTLATRRDAAFQERAAEAVKVLQDPKTGIPGWDDKLYDGILEYAVSSGLPQDEVNNIVDPNVIKIINKARMYDAAQKTAAKKVNMTPKRIRRGAGNVAPGSAADKRQKSLQRKLATGRATDDDAIALLTGRWGVKSR